MYTRTSPPSVALITGGSRGIGRAIALRLAEAGANIAILYAGNEAAASETCAAIEALGVKAFSAKCDVSNSEDVTAAVKGVHDALGKVDILVNNAGITRDGISLRMKEEDFRRVIDVNLTGAFLVTQAVPRCACAAILPPAPTCWCVCPTERTLPYSRL